MGTFFHGVGSFFHGGGFFFHGTSRQFAQRMLEMKRGNHTPYEDMEEDAPIEETRDTFFIKAIPDAAYDKLVEETVHRRVKLLLIQHIKSVYQTPM